MYKMYTITGIMKLVFNWSMITSVELETINNENVKIDRNVWYFMCGIIKHTSKLV